jgi:hypothetical protein
MPLTLPHTFVDGPGNIASGAQVMDNFNAVNAGVAAATVTVLPGSPVNGQDCYFLADATNGVVWHLKYRSASASAYKWEFVGGAALFSEVLTAESTASTTYVALTTAGPTVTLPLAGDYAVTVGATATENSAAWVSAAMSYDIGASAAVDADAALLTNTATQFERVQGSVNRERRKTGMLATAALTAKYRNAGGSGTASFQDRWMRVTPVRVG